MKIRYSVKQSFAIVAMFCLVCLILFGLNLFTYHSLSACSKCGMICQSTKYEFPILGYCYRQTDDVIDSKLSIALRPEKMNFVHEHSWHFLHGGGNGRFGIGKNNFHMSVLEDEVFSDGISRLAMCLNCEDLHLLRSLLCSPKSSLVIYETLVSLDFLSAANSIEEMQSWICLLYTSPSPRDRTRSRMPSSA